MENKVQAEIVLRFGQLHPKKRRFLFAVNNNSNSAKQGAQRKAIGVQSGVSDLILISPKTGRAFGVEVKEKGKRHSIKHLKNQISWGAMVHKAGGSFIMTADPEEALRQMTAFILNKKYHRFLVPTNIDFEKKTHEFK